MMTSDKLIGVMVFIALSLAVAACMTAPAHSECGTGDCCQPNPSSGCEDAACCQAVCEIDAYCCENEWDACCVNQAIELCSELTGCHIPPVPESCNINAGFCCEENGTPGCDNIACCAEVCMHDSFCCDVLWDAICVQQVFELGCGCFGSPSQPLPQPPAFSCEGHCGGAAPSGCWCDEACCDFGDCCVDKGKYCPGCEFGLGPPLFDGDWCKEGCGGLSETGGCWCDEACVLNDDCCSTVCVTCSDLEICQSVPADLTGSGDVNTLDLLILLENWGPCQYDRCAVVDQCEGDFNHDDVVNILDLLYMLENWG